MDKQALIKALQELHTWMSSADKNEITRIFSYADELRCVKLLFDTLDLSELMQSDHLLGHAVLDHDPCQMDFYLDIPEDNVVEIIYGFSYNKSYKQVPGEQDVEGLIGGKTIFIFTFDGKQLHFERKLWDE
jgi:hypothetical protein